MSIQYPLIGSNDWGDTINGNFLDLDNRETESSNKIGDLSTSTNTDKSSIIAITNEINADLSEKANQVDLMAHTNALVTDVNGVHGMKIETGTWTPTLIGYNGGEATYSIRSGSYVKQGKMCLISFNVTIASKGNIVTGPLEIGGLPFNSIGSSSADLPQMVYGDIVGITYPTNCVNLGGRIYLNTNVFLIRFNKNDGNSGIAVQDINISATTSISASMIYRIA